MSNSQVIWMAVIPGRAWLNSDLVTCSTYRRCATVLFRLLCRCRGSARVTLGREPASACAGVAARVTGAATASRAAKPMRSFFTVCLVLFGCLVLFRTVLSGDRLSGPTRTRSVIEARRYEDG